MEVVLLIILVAVLGIMVASGVSRGYRDNPARADEIGRELKALIPPPAIPQPHEQQIEWTPSAVLARVMVMSLDEAERLANSAYSLRKITDQWIDESIRNGTYDESFTVTDMELTSLMRDGSLPESILPPPPDEVAARAAKDCLASLKRLVEATLDASPVGRRFLHEAIGSVADHWASIYNGARDATRGMIFAYLLSDWLTDNERDALSLAWKLVFDERPASPADQPEPPVGPTWNAS
jgi:hypothetical protein